MFRINLTKYMFFGCCTQVLLKRGGKPNELPEYKQVYLPYDTPPTKLELSRERKKFAHAYAGRMEHRRLLEVKDVPENMYTYGKEGMSVPISLFKDQADPVIGPEWTYPGIYENKIVCQPWSMYELIEQEKLNTFQSPWLREVLEEQTMEKIDRVNFRLAMLKIKCVDLFQKERGAQKRAAGATIATPGEEVKNTGKTATSAGLAKGKSTSNDSGANAAASKTVASKSKTKK